MSAKGSGISQGGAHSCFFGGMWWVEHGVTGIAVPTRKFVGMSS